MKWSALLFSYLIISLASPVLGKRCKCQGDSGLGTAVGTGVGLAAAVVGAPYALAAAGFTSAGVGLGTLASGIQSMFYGGYVASGSAFSLSQSAGAAGIGTATKVVGGLTGGLIGNAIGEDCEC